MTDHAGVGFIGLGNIGGSMALRMVDWPGGLTVYDVVPEATAKCAEAGAHVAANPAEVAERSTVICVMVRDEAQVNDVLTGPEGILEAAAPGTVVVIHSTVGADSPARLAELAAPHGVEVVDAPVSGGSMGAAKGELAVLVGGTDAAFEQVRGPLGCFGSMVVHLGPIGSGTSAKLARNLITFASYAAVGEACRLAEALGLDLNTLGNVVRHSDALTGGVGAIMIRPTAEPMATDDGLYEIFGHAHQLGLKDLTSALELGQAAGVELPMAEVAVKTLGAALGIPDQP